MELIDISFWRFWFWFCFFCVWLYVLPATILYVCSCGVCFYELKYMFVYIIGSVVVVFWILLYFRYRDKKKLDVNWIKGSV